MVATITDMDDVAITTGLTHLVFIQDPDGTTILSTILVTHAGGGEYYTNFLVPAALDIGVYRAVWFVYL